MTNKSEAETEGAVELRAAAQYVYDKFVEDRRQGYVTRDKTFAIEILGRALTAAPAPAAEASAPETAMTGEIDEWALEAAARALCEADGVDPSDNSSWLTDEPLWTEYRDQARATILAYEAAKTVAAAEARALAAEAAVGKAKGLGDG